jgi:thiol:disulfide interchange protein
VNKRFAPFGESVKKRLVVGLISIALLAAGSAASAVFLRSDVPTDYHGHYYAGASNAASDVWTDFSPQILKAAHEEGRSVIVNFTAAWCKNCALNKSVLQSAAARELYAEKGIILLTADITSHNPPAQSLLHHLGSRSIPFLAIFPADSPQNPVIMRDIISKDKYLAALKNLP